MIDDLSAKLCEITGYDAISMQPNSGAQGEYAGLLTIAAYHRANGDDASQHLPDPDVAHGTNPAMRQMVGWKVVPCQIRRERRYRSRGFPREGRSSATIWPPA